MPVHTNQVSTSIDIRGNGDWYISFGSQNNFNEMSIYFRWNMNDGIYVNQSRSIRSISLRINSLKSGTEMRKIGFGMNSGDGTPPRNIKSFELFDRGTFDFFNSRASWNGTDKIEIKNPEGNSIFKISGRKNNYKVEKLGTKIL